MNKDEQVIKGFRDVFNKIAMLNKSKMESELKEYKSSEVHCIEYIGNNINFDVECNVTKLAESFYMTRGAISKLTKKLMKKGVIESYQKPENKKEIYFSLTTKGKEVYMLHEKLHKESQARDKAVFEQVTDEQFDIIINFAQKYNSHLDKEISKARYTV